MELPSENGHENGAAKGAILDTDKALTNAQACAASAKAAARFWVHFSTQIDDKAQMAAKEIHTPGIALLSLTWIRKVQMAGVKPPKIVCDRP